MEIVQRTKPVDKGRAKKILGAVVDSFGNVDRSRVKTYKPGGTHYRVTPQLRAKYQKAHPGLPAPTSIVYPSTGGNKPIGVVFSDGVAKGFDLGMGTGHRHKAGGVRMQHVWFTKDLKTAYSDVDGTGRKAATAEVTGRKAATAEVTPRAKHKSKHKK
jgi:hypothetical protein